MTASRSTATLTSSAASDLRPRLAPKAREELGKMELRAPEARGARAALIAWRDRYAKTPKTADELLGSLSTVLQWAADRGESLRTL